MISVIICSRTPFLSNSLKNNIHETIGVEYELIIIDNSSGIHNIFSAYNEGVRRSRYSILCFMHDDIIYHTNNWGKCVINHFTDENIGMIGVAGSSIKTISPSPVCASFDFYHINIIQHLNGEIKKSQIKRNKHDFKEEVVVIDGVWFCIKKELFSSELYFDEKTYSGFHVYDMDISFQIGNVSKLYVVYDILIEHLSSGNLNKMWYENTIKFTEKWKTKFPATISSVRIPSKIELANLYNFIQGMAIFGFEQYKIREIVIKYFKPIRQFNFSPQYLFLLFFRYFRLSPFSKKK